MTNAFRRLSLIIMIAGGLAGPVSAASPEEEAAAAGQAWAKAIMTRDVETEMKLLPPTVFAKPGERERQRLLKLHDREMAIVNRDKWLSFAVRPPTQTVKINKTIAVVLPYSSELATSKGRLQTHSALIALSEEGSGKWFVLDATGQNPRSLKIVIPGYAGNLQLPPPLVTAVKTE